MLAPILCLLSGLRLLFAWQPDFELRINQTILEADCYPRLSVVVNGTSPGPLLRMEEGQHYWIRVYNDLPLDNTTIHWHGFSQYLSPYSDGTPLGSGWPIPAGHFYDYEFQLEPGFVGTYFYHSHVGAQAQTAYGPIIVESKDRKGCPVEYDEELVMLTNDYYHATDPTQEMQLLNDTFMWVGDPQTLLINGHGPYTCNASTLPAGEMCADSSSCGLSQIFVKPATKYRVRVIATGALSYLQLKLEGHEMSVFEVDGTYIEPIPIEDLQIQVGQRYSVLIETKADPEQQDYLWRMRSMWRPTRTYGAAMWTYLNSTTPPPRASLEPAKNDDILQRTHIPIPIPADIATRVPLQNETYDWIDGDFRMYNSTDTYPPDEAVTKVIWLNNQQVQWGPTGKGLRWVVNGRPYYESGPQRPILLNIYDQSIKPDYEAAAANNGFDPGSQTYPVKKGEVLDIVIQALPGPSGLVEAHPWHSHGAKYWDMGQGMGNFSYPALAATLQNRTGSPIKRDTSVAYPGPGASYLNQTIPADGSGGWRLLRIVVEDPGLWLLHCHIYFHQLMGMQVPLLYAGEDLPPIPSSLLAEYTTFGGGAFGKTTYDSGDQDFVPASYFPAAEAALNRSDAV